MMCMNKESINEIVVNGARIEVVNHFTLLNSAVLVEGALLKLVNNRIVKACDVFIKPIRWKLQVIFSVC